MNFRRDVASSLKRQLEGLGYEIGSMQEDRATVIAYLGACRRRVPVRPRRVLRARTFDCPPEYREGLADVHEAVRIGRDLTPYLSKGVKNLGRPDRMLDHWGIHHLHLGRHRSDDFVERTEQLLYCRFDYENVYFICVAGHGDWSSQHMIKILHENWPDSIKQYRLRDVLGVEVSVTDEDVAALWRGNISPLIEVSKGVVYYSPGGGVLTNGDNLADARTADKMLESADRLQKDVVDNFDEIRLGALEMGLTLTSPTTLRLVRQQGYWFIEDAVSCRLLCVVLGRSPLCQVA